VTSPFRDQFEYNNFMYGLSGRVAEVMAEGATQWEQLLTDQLLTPLGMTSTRVLGQSVLVNDSRMAKPYVQLAEDVVPGDPSCYKLVATLILHYCPIH
jgi:CubicO group peptidase (beta-lactamase class C family)